jgi:hypothetical protein
MGIREWARDRAMKEPMPGVLKVTAVDFTDGAGLFLTGVVSASGVEPTPVQRAIRHPRGKALAVFRHLDLPIVVDRTDPRRLRVIWDAVPEDRRLEFIDAARRAEQMRDAQSAERADCDPAPGSDPAAAPTRPGIIQHIHTAQLDGAVLDVGEAARRAVARVRRAAAAGEKDSSGPPSAD